MSDSSKKFLSENVVESIKDQNITKINFFIQKAEIEVVNQNGKDKFIGSVKFEKPDKYLISLKSRSGIEGARIYLSNDTILVNDRLNKKIYFVTSLYLKKKYGFSQSILPLIFGDVVFEKNCEDSLEKCSEDRLNIECLIKGAILDYKIDCKKRKAISVSQKSSLIQPGIEIKYEGFSSIGNILIPKIVEFEDSLYDTKIKIRILKVELPWNGTIKFIPGKGYELIELV